MPILKIMGYQYTITTPGDTDSIGGCGTCDSKMQKIQVASNLAPEQKQSTILHESMEALNYHLQLGLKHETIMRLEAALFQVLGDNGVDLSKLGE